MKVVAELAPATMNAIRSAGVDPSELVARCIRRAFESLFFGRGVPTAHNSIQNQVQSFSFAGVPTVSTDPATND